MNVWTSMILICGVTAYKKDDYYNVGTVLFTRSDLQKEYWDKREIQLLEARRHFQELLPPPTFIVSHDNSLDSLFKYIRDSYSVVKRQAQDSQTDNIMTAAISDLFGGYLKLWVLPITKFTYYGGTTSQDDALKIHDLYNEIKSYLNTNGNGWRSPNPSLLCTVPIKVLPHPIKDAGFNQDSCDSLAYYEKTKSGYSIPLPYIEWQADGETMFLPLKNDFLVPLSQPVKPDPLIKYYDLAKNCINANDVPVFEKNFQNWLGTQVIPHLNDEKLYPALGSVLQLVNNTKNPCDTLVDMYCDDQAPCCILNIPINMTLLIVIIILEMAWCIPALCYLIYTKYKKRRDKHKNVYAIINKKGDNGYKDNSCVTDTHTRCCCLPEFQKSAETMFPSSQSNNLDQGISITYGKKTRQMNLEKNTFLKKLINCNRHQHIKISISKKCGPNEQVPQATSACSNVNIDNWPKSEGTSLPETSLREHLIKSDTVTQSKCTQDDQNVERKIDQILRYEKDTQIYLPAKTSKSNQSEIEKSSKTTMAHLEKRPKSSKEKGRKKYVTLPDGNSILEITIDNRPRDTIAFNVGHNFADRTKPSRIPKLKFNSSESQTLKSELQKNEKKVSSRSLSSKRRSYIPQPKYQKATKDDLSLNIKTNENELDKLNTTI